MPKSALAVTRMDQDDILITNPGEERSREAGRGYVALGQEVEAGSDGKEQAKGCGPDPVSIGLVLVAESSPG